MDVELTNQPVSREQLDFIYQLKTGALLEASMMIGAVLAGASKEELQTVERIAANVGLAFQIQDDILDVVGDEATLGKPIGSDVRSDKTTFVALKGLADCRILVAELTDRAVEALAKIDPRLHLHDFRLVNGKQHDNYIFDVLTPEGYSVPPGELIQRIEDGLQAAAPRPVHAHIHIDSSYSPVQR